MKQLILAFSILLVSAPAFAAGIMRSAIITPRVFGIMSSTKASKTLTTTTYAAVRVQPSAAVTVKRNGSGDSWPIAANVVQDSAIAPDTASLVFSVTSSATKTKIYYQAE